MLALNIVSCFFQCFVPLFARVVSSARYSAVLFNLLLQFVLLRSLPLPRLAGSDDVEEEEAAEEEHTSLNSVPACLALCVISCSMF